MPKFILPPLKKEGVKNVAVEPSDDYDPLTADPWYRKIRIPVNKEIVDALSLGEDVALKLTGEIKSLESRESESSSARYELELEMSSIEAYVEEGAEFSELADD